MAQPMNKNFCDDAIGVFESPATAWVFWGPRSWRHHRMMVAVRTLPLRRPPDCSHEHDDRQHEREPMDAVNGRQRRPSAQSISSTMGEPVDALGRPHANMANRIESSLSAKPSPRPENGGAHGCLGGPGLSGLSDERNIKCRYFVRCTNRCSCASTYASGKASRSALAPTAENHAAPGSCQRLRKAA
jgi:hypothetical protein